MSFSEPAVRTPGSGLHPRHYAALKTEIVRTGAQLSRDQLLDLADALHNLIRLRRSGRPFREASAWVGDEPRSFA